jgi:hypothetical protein
MPSDPVRLSGLLETPRRAGVWPDSVQVPGGFALFWAAHPVTRVWLTSGLQPAGRRDEAWLKSASVCQAAWSWRRCSSAKMRR